MDDRTRTVAAVSIIVGFVVLAAIVTGIVLTSRKVVSPLQDESAIKIIVLTPTPVPGSTLPTAQLTASPVASKSGTGL